MGTAMPLHRRHILTLAGLAAASSALPRPTLAQSWPSRPLRLLVPFSAGGTTDLIARLMAQWLSDRLGQQVIVENRPGGGTNIAVQAAVNAPRDGYTLLFTVATGIDVVHVPYPGGPQLITDLLTGRVQAGIDALPNSLPHIRSGGVRALAMLSATRVPLLPDVPSIRETIPDFEASTWSGIGVPAGTPPEIVERLNRETNAGLADAGMRARFAEVGAVPLQFTPAELRALIARDAEKWARVVKQAGMKPE